MPLYSSAATRIFGLKGSTDAFANPAHTVNPPLTACRTAARSDPRCPDRLRSGRSCRCRSGPALPAISAPSPSDKRPATVVAQALLLASATIGCSNAPLQALFLTPGVVGVAQANLQVPALDTGHDPLVITVNGVASAPAVVSAGGS